MKMAGLEPLPITASWTPWLIACVHGDQTGLARRLASHRAAKDKRLDVEPAFYVVWDQAIISQGDLENLIFSLGGEGGRRIGGVGVIRIESDPLELGGNRNL